MNWLDSILQMLGMGGSAAASSSTGPYGYGAPTYPQEGQAGQSVAIPAGAGTSAGGLPGASTGAGNSQSPLTSALGKIDLTKFSHPQQPAAPAQRIGLTTLPEFPDVSTQPSLQGLMAAIEARRQRLAQLGVGG